MCNSNISLDKNQLGLVFDDKYFLCEECHSSHTKDEVENWTQTKMQDPSRCMPIALWLIHEQNKNKIIMSMSNEK